MHFDPAHYLLISLIVLASSVVQGAVGFASGLFGTPLLMLTGLALPDAVAISLVSSAFQNCIAAWQLRREIDYRRALRPMCIRFAMLPLGVLALRWIGQESNAVSSQLVGAIVLAIVAVQQVLQVPPQPRLHIAWEWLAFGLGGFLLGLSGMGGPPMMLWALAHDWPLVRTRAFMYFIFTTGLVPQALLLWCAFGHRILWSMLLGAAVLPAVLIGLYLGLALSRVLPEPMLRRLSIAVLVVIAVSAIVSPYLQGRGATRSGVPTQSRMSRVTPGMMKMDSGGEVGPVDPRPAAGADGRAPQLWGGPLSGPEESAGKRQRSATAHGNRWGAIKKDILLS